MSGRLAINDLTLCYRGRPAVHHLTAQLPAGAFAAVVGPNGAGKSTLLAGILGWIPATGGTVAVDGAPVAAGRVAYLAQRRTQDHDFPVTVGDVAAMGRYQARGLWRGFTAADRAAVEAALDEMGMAPLRDRPMSQLSGGQQQRAFIARALATGADILLLDEPLAGLDEPTAHDLMRRLAAWASRDRLVVAVIHDLAAVRRFCTHALLMNRELVACGPVAEAMAPAGIDRCYQLSGGFHAGHDHGHMLGSTSGRRPVVLKGITAHDHDHGNCGHEH